MARKKAVRKTARRNDRKANSGNGANLGFEATLWAAADKLRGHMDAPVYKNLVLRNNGRAQRVSICAPQARPK